MRDRKVKFLNPGKVEAATKKQQKINNFDNIFSVIYDN